VTELIDRLIAGELDDMLSRRDPSNTRLFKVVPNHPLGACSEPR
jgi:hypothetical protein